MSTVPLHRFDSPGGTPYPTIDGKHAAVIRRCSVKITLGAGLIAGGNQLGDGFVLSARDIQLIGQVARIGRGSLLELLQA